MVIPPTCRRVHELKSGETGVHTEPTQASSADGTSDCPTAGLRLQAVRLTATAIHVIKLRSAFAHGIAIVRA